MGEKLSDSPEEKLDQSGLGEPLQVDQEPEPRTQEPFSFLSDEEWIRQLHLDPRVESCILNLYEARRITVRQQPDRTRSRDNPNYVCVVKQPDTRVPRRIDEVCGWYRYNEDYDRHLMSRRQKGWEGEALFRSIKTGPSEQSLSCLQELHSPFGTFSRGQRVMAICRGPGDQKLQAAYMNVEVVAASLPFESYGSSDWHYVDGPIRHPQNLTWERYYYNRKVCDSAGIVSVMTEDQIKLRMYGLLLTLWREDTYCNALNRFGLPLTDAKGWIEDHTDVNAIKDELNHLGLLIKELHDHYMWLFLYK